jgi:hypothetical protein
MRIITSAIILLLLLGSGSSAKAKSAKQYYLRHSIIYLGENLPKVFTDQIIFTTRCVRGVDSEVYSGKILRRGTTVKIESVGAESDFAKVSFSSENQSYTILLKNNSKKDFDRSFNLIFAQRVPKEYYKEPRTKEELIKYYGFPISMCKEGDVEEWFYIPEFAGPAGGYDGFWMKIKDNKIIDVYGYI